MAVGHLRNRATVCSMALFAAIGLGGCAKTADDFTDSGFKTPVGISIPASELNQTVSGYDRNAKGDGYAYVVGNQEGDGFRAYSGILDTSAVSRVQPESGSVTLLGTYEVASITQIDLSSTFLFGKPNRTSGNIELTADFDDNTLTGRTPSGNLRISGEFSGKNLGGSVRYLDTAGKLTGLIDGNEAVGAFHGNDGTTIFAGGFLAVK